MRTELWCSTFRSSASNSALVTFASVMVLSAQVSHAAITSYTDEATFLAALSAAGHSTVVESFEDDAVWGGVRTTIGGGNNVAASISARGVTWSPNNAGSGVTTGNGPARTGLWAIFELPHGNYSDPFNPITDGFVATTTASVVGFGGWFSAQGGSATVRFFFDGVRSTGFGASAIGSQPIFLGAIDTAGFVEVEVVEQDGTAADQNLIFADDFTLGVPSSSLGTCGNSIVELGEQCDDGNTSNGDCCAGDCSFEVLACNDGDACTSGDFCSGGVCSGSALDCSDSNICTDDSCNPVSGCVNANNAASCDDGDSCTIGDVCIAGSCSSGAPLDCNDDNVCTDDSCNPASGCVYANNSASCDDGNPATLNDQCSNGVCAGTDLCTGVTCAALDQCHGIGTCDPGTGICDDPILANGTACDDGDICTTTDVCSAGLCSGAVIPGCAATSTTTVTIITTTTTSTTTTLPFAPCGSVPTSGCLTTALTMVKLSDKVDDAKDLFKWKWLKGDEYFHVELGEPTTTDIYAVCLYDSSAGIPTLVSSMVISPSAKWFDKAPKGFKYKDADATEDGVIKVKLVPGGLNKSKVKVKAKGINIPMPLPVSATRYFDQDSEVVVQLVSTSGVCWQSAFGAADTKKNKATLFVSARR